MDTTSFLQHVLPSQGHYVLAYRPDGQNFFKHKVFTDVAAMAAAAQKLDAAHDAVYHACATYKQPRYYDEAREKWRTRTADNAAFIRAQWLDIDVGEGRDKYASREDALAALKDLCKRWHLPAPTIVSSGLGLHVYWTFTQDIAAAQATKWLRMFKQACLQLGFKQDPSRTGDIASILRPAGTHHRKSEPAREVRVLREGKPVDAAAFYAKLPVAEPVDASEADEWLSGTAPEYAPSDTRKVVEGCRAARLFIKRKAKVSYDGWRSMIGVLKHTTDGEASIHRWSALDDRYDRGQTQEKIDDWHTGPARCDTIAGTDLGEACQKCPHRGKITTPVSLGYTADAPPPRAEQPAPTKSAAPPPPTNLANNPAPETMPFWPKGYQWDGKFLQKFMPANPARKVNPDAHWKPICRTLYYPFMRYENDEQQRSIRICALLEPTKNRWRTFEIPTKQIADGRSTAHALGAHEVLYMNHCNEDNRQYIQDVLHGLRTSGVDANTFSRFGWHGDTFVLGNKHILPNGKVEDIFLSDKIPSDLRCDWGQKGSIEDWVRIVDDVYNRPGVEAFQFIILASMGSPLVHLIGSENSHGVPIGLTGPSGLSKTITCAVACAIYGHPKRFVIQANEDGTTLRALFKRQATMCHIPMTYDEITGRETSEMQSLTFSLANGKGKLRLRADGTEIDPDESWAANSFVTGNLNITRQLAGADRDKAAATQVRCFEIPLKGDYLRKHFKGLNAKEVIEGGLLADNYGVVGMKYLRTVVKNRKAIIKRLRQYRTSYAATTIDETRERFYYDLIATAIVAGEVAKKMGLINFDLEAVEAWAYQHVLSLRVARHSSLDNDHDYMQAFLSKMQRHTLITQHFRKGRPNGRERIIEPQFEMLARCATEDRKMFVTYKAFKDWCRREEINEQWLFDKWVRSGLVKKDMTRVRIGSGTKMQSVPVACIEVEYDCIDAMPDGPGEKVVSLADKKAGH